jgi:pyridinium-3,5-bisthiocarboxylic acid mononucleotide nickel chelatase
VATAWFDCRAGASGDMVLGALVDAGAPLEALQAAVDAIGVEPIALSAQPVQRRGIAATLVHVSAQAAPVVRTWANVRDLLERADLAEPVRARALDVFARLAGAEATAHRVAPEQVHFHEVGALDAVADVVGAAAGLATLAVDDVVASEVALGGGMVRAAHGLLPVPGPAVLALLADAGAPVRGGPVPYELCTPTGAAILASAAGSWGDLPPMTIAAVGVGAGTRDVDDAPPNVLRIVLGERTPMGGGPDGAPAVVLEANVDDLDPRLWPAVLARLLEAGASDAWLTPILMKKGRPAHTLHVLAAPERAESLARVVFAETSTLGLRVSPVGKRALARGALVVEVGGRPVRVKTGLLDGAVVNAQPEWDDVAAASAVLGRPAKDVLAEASALARRALADGRGPQP